LTANVTAILFSGSKSRVHLAGRFGIHMWQDVRIRVEGEGDLRVAQDFLHDLRMNALREQQRGARMPEVVKPTQTRKFNRRFGKRPIAAAMPISVVPTNRDEHEERLREDPALRVPLPFLAQQYR
jgi:hypothetical protein